MIDLIRAVSWHARVAGPVIDVGSYVEAQQEHLDMRQAFAPTTKYVGVDVIEGAGVDRRGDLLDAEQMNVIVDDVRPQVVLCLYVLEHVWAIERAAAVLAGMWERNPESWLWVSTHQSQPYHGTEHYPDYWRLTRQAMRRLFDNVGGAHILVNPDTSNPEDVVAVRQPASMVWPVRAFDLAFRGARVHWEHA